MKISKLFLPLIAIAVVALIYFSYFAKSDKLGKFDDFDPNNNANKDIILLVVTEKGVKQDAAAGTATFFGRDSKGMEYPVQVPLPLPDNFNSLKTVKLKGHLHKDHFHAVEITD